MKNLNIILAVTLTVIIAALLLNQAGVLQLSQPGNDASSTEAANVSGQTPASLSDPLAGDASGTTAIDVSLGLEDIRMVLAGVAAEQRQALLDDEAGFYEFVQQEALNRSLLAAAKSSNLENDPQISYLIKRQSENTLREVYLNRVLNNNLPQGFPSGEQVRQYYENNRDNLALEEHVSVWQVFLQVTEDMSADTITGLAGQAEQIANDIKSNTLDFSTAAIRYSRHQASRNNGGYMGLIKVSELLPGIQEALLTLDEGEVSSPIRTNTGFHILKRGAVLPAQEVTFEQVQDDIRNLLLNQARVQIRNRINEQVAESFPVEVDDTLIEDWRSRLRSDL